MDVSRTVIEAVAKKTLTELKSFFPPGRASNGKLSYAEAVDALVAELRSVSKTKKSGTRSTAGWTAEARARAAKRQKKLWAERRAEKARKERQAKAKKRTNTKPAE